MCGRWGGGIHNAHWWVCLKLCPPFFFFQLVSFHLLLRPFFQCQTEKKQLNQKIWGCWWNNQGSEADREGNYGNRKGKLLGQVYYFALYSTHNTLTVVFCALLSLSYIQVKLSVYLQYLRAMGWGYSISVFLIYFIQNVAFIGQNLWLSDWTKDAEEYNNKTYPAWKRDTRVGVFGVLGVVQGNWWQRTK